MTLSPTSDSPAEINTSGMELRQVDPKALIIGSNVRLDARLDKEFINSVKQHGVLQPIVGYENGDGLIVKYGQRRTLAAVETGRPTVPVMVVRSADEVDRIVKQMAENDHRTGLTTAEHVAGFEQLAALGMSAGQIAKRTSKPIARVKAGLAAAENPAAREVVAKHPNMDLLQAAAIAEFSDDDAVVNILVDCVKEGRGFDHQVQYQRDKRKSAAAKAAFLEKLAADGVTVLDKHPGWSDPKVQSLDHLKDGRKNMTEELHAGCPGRAVRVYSYSGTSFDTSEYCTDWKGHGHQLQDHMKQHLASKAELTPEQAAAEKAAEKAERKRVIRFNAQWRSATTVRIGFLKELAGRKKAPAGTGLFLAGTVCGARSILTFALQRGMDPAHTVFGVEKKNKYSASPELDKVADGATDDAKGEVLALVMVLCAHEDNLNDHTWRKTDAQAKRYLLFLQACGYELSDVEQVAAGLVKVAAVEKRQLAAEAAK